MAELFTKQQIASMLNAASKEYLGESVVAQDDLSNVVDFGTALFSTRNAPYIFENLIAAMTEIDFREQVLDIEAPSLYYTGEQYGAIRAVIDFELADAVENPAWELEDGVSVDDQKVRLMKANTRYYDKHTTFRNYFTLLEKQLKPFFRSGNELQGALSGMMLYMQNSLRLQKGAAIKETVCALIASLVNENNSNRCRHLVTEYNAANGTSLTGGVSGTAINNKDFLRYFYKELGKARSRFRSATTTFNAGGRVRQTKDDDMRMLVLSDVFYSFDAYLEKGEGQFKDIYLPQGYDLVSFWQGSGTTWEETDKVISKIQLPDGSEVEVSVTGVAVLLMDKRACGVGAVESYARVAAPNAAGVYQNYHFFEDAQYWVNPDENAVVFLLN